jgi:hypothetical protein
MYANKYWTENNDRLFVLHRISLHGAPVENTKIRQSNDNVIL